MPEQSVGKPRKKRTPPIRTERTQRLLSAVQEGLGIPVLVYWVSSGGAICQNDVTAMAALLGSPPRSSLVGLFLKSDGGNPEAALRFVHLLRQKFDQITRPERFFIR